MTLEVKDRHMYETTWVPVIVLTFHKRRESTNLQNEAPENRVTFSDARHFECGTLLGSSGNGFMYLSYPAPEKGKVGVYTYLPFYGAG